MSENTVTESTELPPLTPTQVAEDFVKTNSSAIIVEELVNHYNEIERLKRKLNEKELTLNSLRNTHEGMIASITDFLREHISENDTPSIDELKELAEELEITLQKEITVKFTVEVEYVFRAPLDYDIDNLSEQDFDVSISHSLEREDLEEFDESIEINDFDAEEN